MEIKGLKGLLAGRMEKFASTEGVVWKYVFSGEDAVAETVLYKYEDFYKRTVICCSTMSGCPVGCTFCGTGKRFVRNLTAEEIVHQIVEVLKDQGIEHDINGRCEKFQIMFMSMGEPMLNWTEVKQAIKILHKGYPNAQLLLSTVGIRNEAVLQDLIDESYFNKKIGLQFSIHQALDLKRNALIPYKNKLTLREIRDAGIRWHSATGRPVYLNYCIDGNNISKEEMARLKDLFPPMIFNFTFSVVCSADENMKEAGYRNLDIINKIMSDFLSAGYNVRVFDPAGQDDIGGGCGQLWKTQEWMQKHSYSKPQTFEKKVGEKRVEALARVLKQTGVDPKDKKAVVKALACNMEVNLSSFLDRCSDKRYNSIVNKALTQNNMEMGN